MPISPCGTSRSTQSRKQRIAFSLPLTRSREWVIGASEKGRFGVAEDSAYVDSLTSHYPESPRVAVPADTDPIGFEVLIEAGTIDATIMDEAAARVIVATSPRVREAARTARIEGTCLGIAA